ncbi:Pycsar system effector family protein [Croceitalea sp. MTPC5]|uniref:Pycsar system effector family protein n=1 Tax=Croceitalea sp. MTPC5 TaxID=3056565 RepID=UPI0030D4C0AF
MSQSKNRAFTNMLTNTLRNHYTLNQMVDRKARIILSVNVVLLSFIISRIIANQNVYDFKFYVIVIGSLFCLVSIIYSVLAIIPESDKNQMNAESLKSGSLNPLYFGNYLSMEEEDFENTMIEMGGDSEFAHRSMLKDMYHIGVILDRKRRYLKNSVVALTIGVCIALILSIILKFVQ